MRLQLKARPIEAHTKGELKRLRRAGFIPVSIHHRGEQPLHLQEETKPLDEFIRHHGKAALLDLLVEPDNKRQTVVVHDVQRDPLTHHLLHVTFQQVLRDEPIKAHIPLVLKGEPEAVRQRTAIVQHQTETIEIRCLPGNLPDHITVDISTLTFGEVLRAADLPPSERYEVLTPPDTVLVSLVSLKAQMEEEGLAQAAEEPATAAENVNLP